MRLHTREEDIEYYEKASDEWLLDKIKQEQESIKINNRMIEDSNYDINICKTILFLRKEGL